MSIIRKLTILEDNLRNEDNNGKEKDPQNEDDLKYKPHLKIEDQAGSDQAQINLSEFPPILTIFSHNIATILKTHHES